MRFRKVFIEHQVKQHPQTQQILSKLKTPNVHFIDKIEQVFNTVHKPYLQKRTTLDLFIGRKEGQLVKRAPDAYGIKETPHYYFIHAYNCIYECQYCYLQGYFKSPDIVLFVNHDEICEEIKSLSQTTHANQTVWFHAGEFSDSLALAGITNEWPIYWQTFSELPNAILELRTKGINVQPLLDLPAYPNIIPTFSLSTNEQAQKFDHQAPSITARLKAAKKLAQHGYKIGIHLDPIIESTSLKEQYTIFLQQLTEFIAPEQIHYVSLGVVRFTQDVYHSLKRNYPGSTLNDPQLTQSEDGKIRYNKPHRLKILNEIKHLCVKQNIDAQKIYYCME